MGNFSRLTCALIFLWYCSVLVMSRWLFTGTVARFLLDIDD